MKAMAVRTPAAKIIAIRRMAKVLIGLVFLPSALGSALADQQESHSWGRTPSSHPASFHISNNKAYSHC